MGGTFDLIMALPAITLIIICLIPHFQAPIRKYVTPVISQIVHDQVPIIIRIQKKHNKFMDVVVRICSSCVSIEFYLTALPFLYWVGYKDQIGMVILCLATGTHVVNALKDLLGCPRPYQCVSATSKEKVRVLEEMKEAEHGAPSMHICLTLILNMYLTHSISVISPFVSSHIAWFYLLCVAWSCFVGWSRLYLGVHTPVDLVFGFFLGISYFFLFKMISGPLLDFLHSSPFASTALLTGFLCILALYPHPVDHTASFDFSVTFLGAAQGFFIGHLGAGEIYRELASIYPSAAVALRVGFLGLPAFVRPFIAFALVAAVKVASRAMLVTITPWILDLVPDCIRLSWQPAQLTASGGRQRDPRGLVVRKGDGIPWDSDAVRRFVNYAVTVAAVPLIDHALYGAKRIQ